MIEYSDLGEDPNLCARFSEESLAIEYASQHGDAWKYIAEWGKWFYWDGRRWDVDLSLRHFDLARRIARAASTNALIDPVLREGSRDRVSVALGSAKTVAAIERLARADRRHAKHASDWDRNPRHLNMLDGILNLTTGEVMPHDPLAYCTKIAGAHIGGHCPTWLNFLNRVTGGDAELIAFLQRFAGYCLTGDTSEHAFLFLWGLGGNGKSTFANVLLAALGSYATTVPAETFVESHNERHPTDMAMLNGVRLAVVPEVADGQRWAGSKIKGATGGDPIRARFMRQDFFEFIPQFKLLFVGNHKPSFRNVDEAMRRRFCLVPFNQKIPAAERDPDLPIKLRRELGGILNWMADGLMAWNKMGLAPPAVVREATEQYLDDEDILRAWLSECCVREAAAFAPSAELHTSYRAWAERTGEKFFGAKTLGGMLEDRGYERTREGLRGFRGIRLRTPQGRLEAVS